MRAQGISIDALRAEIDRLDDQLLDLLARRVETCRSIGALKSAEGAPVMQEERVRAVKRRSAARAEELMLDPSFVLRLYDLIIEHACELETAMIDSGPEEGNREAVEPTAIGRRGSTGRAPEKRMPAKPHTIEAVVLGAGGEVGSALAGALAATARVTGIDRRHGPGVQIACDLASPTREALDALRRADVTVLALPEEAIAATAVQIAGALRPQTLLVDTSSVKAPVVPALEECAARVEVLSVNPLFRPSLGFRGRRVAASTIAPGPLTDWFLDALRGLGAGVVLIDVERHDRTMALAQALVHALVLSFGCVLSEEQDAVDDVLALGPPPLQTIAALLGRLTDGPSETYWSIQASNPGAAAARARAIDAMQRLDALVRHGSVEGFDGLIATMCEALGPSRKLLSRQCELLFDALAEDGESAHSSVPD